MHRGAEVTMKLAVISFLIAGLFTIKAALGGGILSREEVMQCFLEIEEYSELSQKTFPKVFSSAMKCKKDVEFEECKPLWLQSNQSGLNDKKIKDCKCFLSCVASDLNWMKGGIFQWDEFNSIFDDMKNETCSELGKHLIETCKNEVISKDCEGAYELIKCFSRNVHGQNKPMD